MQILELMHRLELHHVQPIRQHPVRLPLQQMLRLVRRDMGHRREHVRAMRRRALDAVTVVNPALARFVVNVKVLEVVVEIDAASAEVASQERCVRGEDGGDVDVSFSAEWDGEAGLPFVEVGDDGFVDIARDVLGSKIVSHKYEMRESDR